MPSEHHDSPLLVEELPHAEQFALWAMRFWVFGYQRQVPVEQELGEAFAKVGTVNGAYLLDTVMLTLAGGRCRALEIHCTCNRRVSADEQCLLAALACHQRGQSREAEEHLRPLLTPSALRIVNQRLGLLAAALRAADLVLAAPANPTRSSATVIPFPAPAHLH